MVCLSTSFSCLIIDITAVSFSKTETNIGELVLTELTFDSDFTSTFSNVFLSVLRSGPGHHVDSVVMPS